MPIKLVLPVSKREIKNSPLAPRLDTLKGKTIALFSNTKWRSFAMLDALEKLLREKQGVKDIIRVTTWANREQPQSALDQAAKADGVYLAVGDWGSCTAWLIVSAVRLEKMGVPTGFYAALNFASKAGQDAKQMGIPYQPIIALSESGSSSHHPVIISRAMEEALDESVHVLTTPAEVLQKEYFEKYIPK